LTSNHPKPHPPTQMPIRKVFVDSDNEDDEWKKSTPDVVQPGLQFVNNDSTSYEIVKLRFEADGALSYGSGFYTKIPGATHDVILTAGHNLVVENGNRTTQLAIASEGAEQFQPVEESNIFACAKYLEKREPMYDYGAILVKRASPTSKSRGYGYSMPMAFGTTETFKNNNVSVIGYMVSSDPGHPVTSTGRCRGLYPAINQIEYLAKTQQGLSGSAVTVEYDGKQSIIAIHTQRPGYVGGGSRGTLLTPSVLREIYSWAGVGEVNKTLQVKDSRSAAKQSQSDKKLPDNGLFVFFPPGWEFARLCVGIDNADKFEIIPAKAATGANLEHYAIACGDKWVSFNTVKEGGRLELVTKLNNSCLFEKGGVKEKKKAMRLVATNTAGKNMQLKASIEGFGDVVAAGAVSSGLSMVQYPKDNEELFTEFWFEG